MAGGRRLQAGRVRECAITSNVPRGPTYHGGMLGAFGAFRVLRAIRFLFMGPFILLVAFVVNAMTYHGQWWVRWVALGIGIAWFLSLLRVIRAAILVGGVAALIAWLAKRKTQSS